MPKRALVLSGGGMFGAWQAGAWSAISAVFQPDLLVGASIGSLNGYLIASGWTPAEIIRLWRSPEKSGFRRLPETIREMMAAKPLAKEYAVVVVDALRMKPRTFTGSGITWKHLVASCAVPLAVVPQRIGRDWYIDGGILNPLPVWAATDLGANDIVGLHALPEFPSRLMKPFVHGFRAAFGYHPPIPEGVRLRILTPSRRLGTLHDAVVWKRDRIEKWLEFGQADGEEFAKRFDNACERG